MSLLTYLLLAIACTAQINEPIAPTNETATAQYYWASLDTEGQGTKFSLGDIICATNKDCYIYCDWSNGCQWTEIDATNANNLYIFCSTNSVCYLMDVFGPQSSSQTSVNIYCSAAKSCEAATFALNSSATVNILCDSGGSSSLTGACTSAKIYATNNHNTNISCTAYDCNDMQLYTAPLSYHAFLTCTGSHSCNNTEITCIHGNGKSILSYAGNKWQCSLDYCCPIIANTPIICAALPHCAANCSNINCISTYIDGTNVASAMTVFCNGNSECKYSKIICPDNGACIVECNAFESCQYAVIDAALSTSLSLRCGRSGCQGANVFCPAGDSLCLIECLGMEYSCHAMQIIQLTETWNSYLSLTCPPAVFTGACTNIRFECAALPGTGEQTYYDPPNQCTQELCCPWSLAAPSFSPTKLPSSSPIIQSIPTMSPIINGKDSDDSGILDGEDDKQLFYIIIIVGFVVLVLCVCVWGIIWFKKKKTREKYGTNDSNVRHSKSSKKSSNNYKFNDNVNVSTSDVNMHKSLNARIPSTQRHLEIEKSMELELQSTTQQTITEYNPSRIRKIGGETHANPPQNTQQLGLADLGNSGWDD